MPGAMGFPLFQCQINIAILSTRLCVMIPATAAAGLCTPGLLQPFVPSWRRLQSSKQKGTIFSPGNRSPSSHKAKQNYAMSQDNVLGMWSLAVCSEHSHSSSSSVQESSTKWWRGFTPARPKLPSCAAGKRNGQHQNKVPKNEQLKSPGPWH